VGAVEGGDVDVDYPADKLFESKSVGARILVISAGVIMNALFAWGVYAALAFTYGGGEDPTTSIAAVDASLLPAGAEQLADLEFGSRVIRINGDTVDSWNDIGAGVYSVETDGVVLEIAGRDPVSIPIPGLENAARDSLYRAIEPLHEATVGAVSPGTPAAAAGLQPLDRVVAIDGEPIRYQGQMIDYVGARAGQAITLEVVRDTSRLTFELVPEAVDVRNPVTGETEQTGRIGISFHLDLRRVTYGFAGSIGVGLQSVAEDAGRVWFVLKGLVVGAVSPRELGGPILIGQVSGQMAARGFEYLLSFMAFFSVNLAILNLLPIPVLDGGHLVFLVAEAVRRRPLSLTVRMRLSQVGLVLLLGLMALAFTNDIVRLFT
jgi:regulator of sigma E protease